MPKCHSEFHYSVTLVRKWQESLAGHLQESPNRSSCMGGGMAEAMSQISHVHFLHLAVVYCAWLFIYVSSDVFHLPCRQRIHESAISRVIQVSPASDPQNNLPLGSQELKSVRISCPLGKYGVIDAIIDTSNSIINQKGHHIRDELRLEFVSCFMGEHCVKTV